MIVEMNAIPLFIEFMGLMCKVIGNIKDDFVNPNTYLFFCWYLISFAEINDSIN